MAMTLVQWTCNHCGVQGESIEALAGHFRTCEPMEGYGRDAALAAKVKAGKLPGKVPDHYARDWTPKPRASVAERWPTLVSREMLRCAPVPTPLLEIRSLTATRL